MNFSVLDRSPCNECDEHTIRAIDKNSDICQACKKRLQYSDSVDPENIGQFSRYSHSGGKTRYVSRRPQRHAEEVEMMETIKEFAEYFCLKNNSELKHVVETGNKTERIVLLRRQMINRIKNKFEAANTIIAKALGMNPATISLAIRGRKTPFTRKRKDAPMI
jgi:hypothetical protein